MGSDCISSGHCLSLYFTSMCKIPEIRIRFKCLRTRLPFYVLFALRALVMFRGDEAPLFRGLVSIIFREWTDTRTFSDLKYISTKI